MLKETARAKAYLKHTSTNWSLLCLCDRCRYATAAGNTVSLPYCVKCIIKERRQMDVFLACNIYFRIIYFYVYNLSF